MKDLYENYRLCPDLKSHETCIVVQQYEHVEGSIPRLFHEHVSNSRLSDDRRGNILSALVIKLSDMSPEGIVRCYLNDRGKHSSADYYKLRGNVSYPEPGVLRTYLSNGDTTAWADRVIVKSEFRRKPVLTG